MNKIELTEKRYYELKSHSTKVIEMVKKYGSTALSDDDRMRKELSKFQYLYQGYWNDRLEGKLNISHLKKLLIDDMCKVLEGGIFTDITYPKNKKFKVRLYLNNFNNKDAFDFHLKLLCSMYNTIHETGTRNMVIYTELQGTNPDMVLNYWYKKK